MTKLDWRGKDLKENQTGKSDFETKVFDIKLWKTIFSDWKIYILTLWNIFCWNDSNVSSGAYLLWLKSLKRYSIPKLNQLSMITPGLGMVYLMLTGVIADKLHSRWFAIIFTQVFNIIGNSILAAWDVAKEPNGLHLCCNVLVGLWLLFYTLGRTIFVAEMLKLELLL